MRVHFMRTVSFLTSSISKQYQLLEMETVCLDVLRCLNSLFQHFTRMRDNGVYGEDMEMMGSQKIPNDWRIKTEAGAKRIRENFKKLDVDIIISSDETFLKFHETTSKVLAPVGAKRIGKAYKIKNDKMGCTVMVSMEMYGSCLLPPFIIFTGVFGKTLMQRWNSYTKSTVLFTANHWMTAETNVLYLQYLLQLYPQKRIGLIYDHAPSHVCNEVKAWVIAYNLSAPKNSKLFIEFIDPCLTSIYQPPDVVMNAPLKKKIRKAYQEHVRSISLSETGLKAGEVVDITRKQLVEFVERAFTEINLENKKTRAIGKSFAQCGLDPDGDNLDKFTHHLDSLGEDGMYKALTEAHAAEVLELTAKHSNS
jgi:hypothetical protein